MAIQTLKRTRLQKCSFGCPAEDVDSSVHVVEVQMTVLTWTTNTSVMYENVGISVGMNAFHISRDPASDPWRCSSSSMTSGQAGIVLALITHVLHAAWVASTEKGWPGT